MLPAARNVTCKLLESLDRSDTIMLTLAGYFFSNSEVGHLLEEADAVCNRLTESNTRAKKRLKELVQVSK